jgi:hypothetical protein
MANEKTQAELDAQIDAGIRVNGNREITPPIHNAIDKAIVNSSLNKKGGGILQALAFYSSAFSLSDPLSLVYKSYVDDLITALDALTQGTNTLTEDLVFNLTVGTKVYSFQVTSAGIIISLIDSADSSNNAAVTIVDKKVQIIGSLQLSEGGVQMQTYPVYWRGDPATPQEGDIREYYSEATDEIITEKYTSGVWTFRGSR